MDGEHSAQDEALGVTAGRGKAAVTHREETGRPGEDVPRGQHGTGGSIWLLERLCKPAGSLLTNPC